ncbi:ATP-dependent 6-phosphofructokinase [bacterium]|nr:ATP-dependent 6-phosphofructokinase [bacterium]
MYPLRIVEIRGIEMKWSIERLGKLSHPSPLHLSQTHGDMIANFVEDDAKIVVNHCWDYLEKCREEGRDPEYFEVAGPRSKLYFQSDSVKAAIVTCGGVCPGLNDVIRGLVMQMFYHYKVKEIFGIKYGFRGMTKSEGDSAVLLSPEITENIHTFGGSFLGSSRGPQLSADMVDFLQDRDIHMLFVIGGDGSMRGAQSIHEECQERDYLVSIIGVPKTIDNDIAYIDRSFGFSTAVEKATNIIACAHVEAKSAFNGIGLVKLMGRHSGFITARSTLASGFVNFALIPEIPFDLDGPNGFLSHLKERLVRRGHAVIVVAEGAGQELMKSNSTVFDLSGNPKLKDIGQLLNREIRNYLSESGVQFTLKYFNPSYFVRSAPANCDDNVYCTELAQNAVHAAFAGRTNTVVGSRHDEFVMIPMDLVISKKKALNPDGPDWLAVLQSTGQAASMRNY